MPNNQEQQNSVNNTNYVDPRNVNAEIIGELRKDKIGRPMLVVEIAVLFAIVLLGLPVINSLLNDENSFLYKLINGNTNVVIVPTEEPKEEFLDGSTLQPLSTSTKMKSDNIVMEKFILTSNSIKCNIYSYNGVLNLDESEHYLEVYSTSGTKLAAVKLTGTYDSVSKEVELTASNLTFNSNYSYTAKIVSMTEDDYPDVTVESDESGIGSFTCTLGNRTIEYTFKNKYLIAMNDTEKVILDTTNTQEYINAKKEFDTKKANLGDIANVEEVVDGFIFNAKFDLEAPGYKIPESVVDYNYYELDTNAKVIHYAQVGKGFDCK